MWQTLIQATLLTLLVILINDLHWFEVWKPLKSCQFQVTIKPDKTKQIKVFYYKISVGWMDDIKIPNSRVWVSFFICLIWIVRKIRHNIPTPIYVFCGTTGIGHLQPRTDVIDQMHRTMKSFPWTKLRNVCLEVFNL